MRDALRFPLEGEPLEALVAAATRATIVVEPPALPIPGAPIDPRQLAIGAVVDELRAARHPERLPDDPRRVRARAAARRSASWRRSSRRELARRFHGSVVVHDVEDPELVRVDDASRPPLRVNRALVETDLVVVVSAAETVLHGGPAALLAAAGADAQRAAGAYSLLETTASQGWHLAVALERALARRVPLIGVSLVLNQPRACPGRSAGTRTTRRRSSASPGRRSARLFAALPDVARREILRSLPTELTAAAAFAGPPSVAHAEALLRAVESRRAELDEPLDAIVIGIPGTTPFLPRERPNPLLAAYLGLGLALRLWRDAFPVVDGGTAILAHRFSRHFAHPTQQPYRAVLPRDARRARPGAARRGRARRRRANARAIESYRAGCTVHPLLPFRDWNACQPALGRLGAVLVAGAARRDDRAPARLRADARPHRGARSGARPRRAATRGSASSSARRTSRCACGGARSRRGTSCGPARSVASAFASSASATVPVSST